jgi:hypothetical protein
VSEESFTRGYLYLEDNLASIQEFESKVLRIFCEAYLAKAFPFIDYSKGSNPQNAEDLVRLLMEAKLYGEYHLYGAWLENSFDGLDESFKKALLLYPKEQRQEYQDNEKPNQIKVRLYEVFENLHEDLLLKHKEICDLNELTGDWDFDPDASGMTISEYRESIKDAISGQEYRKKLKSFTEALAQETLDNSSTDIDFQPISKKEVPPEIQKILSAYFLKNGKGSLEGYAGQVSLTIDQQKIPFQEIQKIVSSICQNENFNSGLRGYALYCNGSSAPEVAKQIGISSKSIKGSYIKRKFIKIVFQEISNKYQL